MGINEILELIFMMEGFPSTALKPYELPGLRAFERMRLSRKELLKECDAISAQLPHKEAIRAIHKRIEAWMNEEEASGRYICVMDLMPKSPRRQTGDRLFLGSDGSSFRVAEPERYDRYRYVKSSVAEPMRQTFFLAPDEAERMAADTLQMTNVESLFEKQWKYVLPEYGMKPFQVDVIDLKEMGVQAEVFNDKDKRIFAIVTGKNRMLDDQGKQAACFFLSQRPILEVRRAGSKSRQKTKIPQP